MVSGNCSKTAPRIAVVLFNLGGPDAPTAVQPFLRNLFSDPAILGVPQPFRALLARLIAARRAPIARGIYAKIGGRSPLLPETKRQAAALQAALEAEGHCARVFVCMRYWHPMSDIVAAEIAAWRPERIVLLPLYPQFSTTTTASSVRDWQRAARKAELTARTQTVCCYPSLPGLAEAIADRLAAVLAETDHEPPMRVLFSAHGLPKRVVARGDPYPEQVEATAAAVIAALGRRGARQPVSLDHVVCYQSRVGPLEWIGPSIEHELERAAADGVPVVVVPIAFVSEHSETLVELDIEYRHRAESLGLKGYLRVPTVGCHPAFIGGLARLVGEALTRTGTERDALSPSSGERICPIKCGGCPCPVAS